MVINDLNYVGLCAYILRNHESLMCADDINAHIYDLHYRLLVEILFKGVFLISSTCAFKNHFIMKTVCLSNDVQPEIVRRHPLQQGVSCKM